MDWRNDQVRASKILYTTEILHTAYYESVAKNADEGYAYYVAHVSVTLSPVVFNKPYLV